MLIYLSLGANIGEREQTIEKALRALQEVGTIHKRSDFYYSEPWGFESEHIFCNLCILLQTDLNPMDLLAATQAIERSLGRTHKTLDRHYQDRPIDIDLIRAFDEEGKEIRVNSHSLLLPHPLWEERDFVKIPLAEIFD